MHLSYFSNFVLLGSFLGIGVGFLISRRRWTMVPAAPLLLAVLVTGVYFFPVTLDRTGNDVIYFTSLQARGPPAWLVLPLVFVVVALVIAGPAEIVGRCFADLTPLTAYRWDLVGSLLGISAFTVLSFLWAPPGGVGRDRGDRRSCCWCRTSSGCWRSSPAAAIVGGAAHRDPAAEHQLVAVLQDHHRGPVGQPVVRRHLGQRHPAPADGAGAVEARAGRAAVLHAVRTHQGQQPRRTC